MPYGGRSYAAIGKAGEYAAASKLALIGHNVLFPSVDEGYDLMLGNGLKIQVKAASLIFQNAPMYKEGVYSFDLRRCVYDASTKKRGPSTQKYRTYKEIADFYILWGIDEDRFWIVPTSIKNKRIYFPRRNSIARTNSHSTNYWSKIAIEKEAAMENRWDLLDLEKEANRLIDSVSVETQPTQKENYIA